MHRILFVSFFLLVELLDAAQAGDSLLGVNKGGLAWLESREASAAIDQMAQASVSALRMNLVSPFSKTLDVIAYANSVGIDVLLVIPLTLRDFYPPDAAPRPAQGNFPRISRISEMDIDRFDRIWSSVLDDIDRRGLRVLAFEIGNEYNSAYFNGDLPIVQGGAILTVQTAREFSFWPTYEAGMRKLLDVAKIVATSMRNSEKLMGTKIVLGAPARPPTDWLRRSGNALVEPETALRTLKNLGIESYVDAYAAHIYPNVINIRPSGRSQAIRQKLDEEFDVLKAAVGSSRPLWITEWGFRAADTRVNRLSYFCAFLSALDQSSRRDRVEASFIFDWNDSPQFRIWVGTKVLDSPTSIFKNHGSEACPR